MVSGILEDNYIENWNPTEIATTRNYSAVWHVSKPIFNLLDNESIFKLSGASFVVKKIQSFMIAIMFDTFYSRPSIISILISLLNLIIIIFEYPFSTIISNVLWLLLRAHFMFNLIEKTKYQKFELSFHVLRF